MSRREDYQECRDINGQTLGDGGRGMNGPETRKRICALWTQIVAHVVGALVDEDWVGMAKAWMTESLTERVCAL